MADHNWKEIKTEYITTDIGLRKLAEKHGVSLSTVGRKSKAEEWPLLRQQYKDETLTKTLEKSSTREANRLSRLMDTTSRAIDVVVKSFSDEDQFNRYLVERREKYALPEVDEDGETAYSERQWVEEKIFRKTDAKALKELTAVLKDLTGLMRDFYNIPTPAQAEAQRIASERLELEKRKSDAVDCGDTSYEIVGIPEEYKR